MTEVKSIELVSLRHLEFDKLQNSHVAQAQARSIGPLFQSKFESTAASCRA